jgi:uncharacterized protein YwgA
MENKPEILWNQFAVIAYLAEKLEDISFGKTALQKLVYFMEEWKNIPLGYVFEFYTYGPFSSKLMGDLDYSASLEAVEVIYVFNGGYQIKKGPRNEAIQTRGDSFLKLHKSDIDEVIRLFAKLAAKKLELLATIHFACREYEQRHNDFSDDDILNAVKALKPNKFSDGEIQKSLGYLRSNKVI